MHSHYFFKHLSAPYSSMCTCSAAVYLKGFCNLLSLADCQDLPGRGIKLFCIGLAKLSWPCHPRSEKPQCGVAEDARGMGTGEEIVPSGRWEDHREVASLSELRKPQVKKTSSLVQPCLAVSCISCWSLLPSFSSSPNTCNSRSLIISLLSLAVL